MLEFPCTACGRKLRLDAVWAGKKCRCGNCGQVVQAPAAVSVASTVGFAAVPPTPRGAAQPGDRMSLADMQTVAPTQDLSMPERDLAAPKVVPPPKAAARAELHDFLGPAQSPGEIGWLGGYRVLRLLGAGGMGVVFHAEDVQLERPVALKAMLPVMAASPSNRQRFVLEAQAAAAIEHDHIVTIYGVDEDRGIPFIAMQLLNGESLEERLQRVGRLSVPEGLRIARQIASGLAMAHERGLIHRDVKPSNLFLVNEEAAGPHHSSSRVKILDFGLARSVSGDSQLTRNGAIIGTPAYMAPEQSRGQKLDGRCDLFSLGCVMYRMFTGRLPFQGEDAITVLLALASEEPPPPHQVNPQVPVQVSRLIVDLLAKDPKLRPPSARAVIQRIQGLETELGVAPSDSGSAVASSAALAGPVKSAGMAPGSTIMATVVEIIPEERKKKKWVVPALLGGAGLILAAAAVLLALAIRGNRSDIGSLEQKADDKPKKARSPVKPAPPALDPEVLAMLRTTVKNKNYSKTDAVGFTIGPDFEEIPPEGALLIGFELGLGNVWGKDCINSVRPIFLMEKGEVFGRTYGTPTPTMVIVKAKKGYAVGAVALVGGLQVDWMKVTFMRIGKKFLDPDESYESDDIGPRGHRQPRTVGGSGPMVIGVHGKSNGQQCQCLGLVLRGKVKQ